MFSNLTYFANSPVVTVPAHAWDATYQNLNNLTLQLSVSFYEALARLPVAQTAPANCPTSTISAPTNAGGLDVSGDRLRQWILSQSGSYVFLVIVGGIAMWGLGKFNEQLGRRAVEIMRRVIVAFLLLLTLPFLWGWGTALAEAAFGQSVACYIPLTPLGGK